MKSKDVLFVINGLRDLNLDLYEFGVITGIETETSRTIFELGEVMVLDKMSGREPDFTEGRKPGKWSVTCETFGTLEEAMACRERVLSRATS